MPVWLENDTTDPGTVVILLRINKSSVHTMPDRVPFSFHTI